MSENTDLEVRSDTSITQTKINRVDHGVSLLYPVVIGSLFDDHIGRQSSKTVPCPRDIDSLAEFRSVTDTSQVKLYVDVSLSVSVSMIITTPWISTHVLWSSRVSHLFLKSYDNHVLIVCVFETTFFSLQIRLRQLHIVPFSVTKITFHLLSYLDDSSSRITISSGPSKI